LPPPSLPVRFSIAGKTREIDALIDTGFDGHLVVPVHLVPEFPTPAFRQRIQTASGQVVGVPVYAVALEFVSIRGSFDALAVAIGDEFLLGLLSINRLRLTLDHGLRVIVEP
jgi:predicted aspartyl protease